MIKTNIQTDVYKQQTQYLHPITKHSIILMNRPNVLEFHVESRVLHKLGEVQNTTAHLFCKVILNSYDITVNIH